MRRLSKPVSAIVEANSSTSFAEPTNDDIVRIVSTANGRSVEMSPTELVDMIRFFRGLYRFRFVLLALAILAASLLTAPAFAAPGECVCEPLAPGDPPVILLSETTCALKLAPVTRALETCTRAYDLVSSATTAIAALPPPVAPEAPSRLPMVVATLAGAGVGAGLGVALTASESDRPVVLGLGSIVGAVVVGAVGAVVAWVAED